MDARSRKSSIIWTIKTTTNPNLMKKIENKSEITLIGLSVQTYEGRIQIEVQHDDRYIQFVSATVC